MRITLVKIFIAAITGQLLFAVSNGPALAAGAGSAVNGAGAVMRARDSDGMELPPLVKIFLSPNKVARDLRDRGYRDIVWIDRWLPGYVVEACLGGDRYRLKLNRNALIKKQKRIGSCSGTNVQQTETGGAFGGRTAGLDAKELRPLLRARGFSNIKITDRQLPGYRAEACRGHDRFELRLNRFGDIRGRSRIGSCDVERASDVISSSDLKPLLRSRGFSRIEILDGRLPRFVARACKGDRRWRVVLDRFGSIVKKRRAGSCENGRQVRGLPLTEIRDVLRNRRYHAIEFTDRELPGYGARACRNIRRFALRIDRFGRVKKRRKIGWCKPRLLKQIKKILPRRITGAELDNTDRLHAEDCQEYLESLLEQGSILFDVASAEIGRESFPLLRRLARIVKRCPQAQVEVAGHTDSDGTRDNNQDLSERRAESVVRFLRDEAVPRRRLSAVGYGEDKPVASNSSPARKALNRRIEFVVDWDDG